MIPADGRAVPDSFKDLLESTCAAVIVIDMQNDLLDDAGVYARRGDNVEPLRGIVPNIVKILKAARVAGLPVAFTLNSTLPDSGSDSTAWLYFKRRIRPESTEPYTVVGTWGHNVIPQIPVGAGDLLIPKFRSDAFVGTSLEQLLRARCVETVVIVGVVTNGCVEVTARHAACLDFYTIVVEDACASTSGRLHLSAIELLRGRHDVVTTNQVIGCLRKRGLS